jgi:hypothetical protein
MELWCRLMGFNEEITLTNLFLIFPRIRSQIAVFRRISWEAFM